MISDQLEIISPQLEMISDQLEMISDQLEMISPQLEMISVLQPVKVKGLYMDYIRDMPKYGQSDH